MSPLKDRELDLRGYQIPAIENLAVTKDQLDSIDLTDNQIHALANLPVLKRLHQLLLANNPVRTVSQHLGTSVPNLRTLVLTNAQIERDHLAQLAVTLARCRKLEHLSLKGCPVQQAPNYRAWIIFNCKRLRSLDYERVSLKVRRATGEGNAKRETERFPRPLRKIDSLSLGSQERELANSLFLTPAGEPTPLHTSLLAAAASTTAASAPALVSGAGAGSGTAAKTFEPGVEPAESQAGHAGRLLTKEEKDRVRKAIEGAESVEEVRPRLTG